MAVSEASLRWHLRSAVDAYQRQRVRDKLPPVPGLDDFAEYGPRLLDPARAARKLGISERSLRRRVAAGDIEPVRVGRLVRFTPEQLAARSGQKLAG